jgi:hypothetical protein
MLPDLDKVELIPEAMISRSTIDKVASVDDKEILTVSDLVQETFEYLVQFQMAQRDSRPNIRIYGFHRDTPENGYPPHAKHKSGTDSAK